jgi:outer membrane protein
MKKIPLITNIVLAVAIVILYVLYFTGKSAIADFSFTGDDKGISAVEGELKVAYVNIDTLLNKYDRFYDMRQRLADKQRRLEADLASRTRQLQRAVEDFQNKVQRGLVTRSTAEDMQRQLAQDEQNLYLYRDQLTMELAEEEQVLNRQLLNDIATFLEEFNKNRNYHFIMSHSFGGALLYATDSLDITNEVVKGLNQKFKDEFQTRRE